MLHRMYGVTVCLLYVIIETFVKLLFWHNVWFRLTLHYVAVSTHP
jgi:hypothetical protein